MSELIRNLMITFGVAMVPVIELRGAIPIGIGLGLTWWQALGAALAGNLTSAAIWLYVLPILVESLGSVWGWLHRVLIDQLHEKQAAHTKTLQRWGALALVVFVAIPFPGTGVWTGGALAYLFGIPYRRALLDMFIGLVISGMIVTLISLGAFALF